MRPRPRCCRSASSSTSRFVPFYPLASGLLTGKYKRDAPAPEGARLAKREQIATDEQWDVVEALSAYADERGVPLAQIAIGALLEQPAVASVIAGATKPAQIEANAAAAGWVPSGQDIEALKELLA